MKPFDVSIITCVNEALSKPNTRDSSSVVMCACVFQLHGPRQQVQTGIVLGERTLEQRKIEPVDVLSDVGKRVFGNRVEEHVGVAQAQVEIEEDDGVGFGFAASEQPRFTARLVVPTPPVAPVTAMIEQPRPESAGSCRRVAGRRVAERRRGLRS